MRFEGDKPLDVGIGAVTIDVIDAVDCSQGVSWRKRWRGSAFRDFALKGGCLVPTIRTSLATPFDIKLLCGSPTNNGCVRIFTCTLVPPW